MLHPAAPLALEIQRPRIAIGGRNSQCRQPQGTFPAHSPYHLSCRANLQRRQTRGFHPLNIRRPVRITASTCLHRRVDLSVSPCRPRANNSRVVTPPLPPPLSPPHASP